MAETQLQASTDNLTGLLNRRTLENRCRRPAQRATPFALAMADLDHFKELNDTYGHETGDRALRLFAETLRASCATEDLLCRHGGEEFAIVLPDCTRPDAHAALEAVRIQTSSTRSAPRDCRPTPPASGSSRPPTAKFESALRRADAPCSRPSTTVGTASSYTTPPRGHRRRRHQDRHNGRSRRRRRTAPLTVT